MGHMVFLRLFYAYTIPTSSSKNNSSASLQAVLSPFSNIAEYMPFNLSPLRR